MPPITNALWPKKRRSSQDPTSTRDLSRELLGDLTTAQQERDQRSAMSTSGHPQWVAYERSVMLDSTIALLVRHQLPIDADEAARAVRAAEQRAEGHSDYSAKWALGCAEYVANLAVAKQENQ